MDSWQVRETGFLGRYQKVNFIPEKETLFLKLIDNLAIYAR
jgi:hypothetical protein